jgi:hypothetical protein
MSLEMSLRVCNRLREAQIMATGLSCNNNIRIHYFKDDCLDALKRLVFRVGPAF